LSAASAYDATFVAKEAFFTCPRTMLSMHLPLFCVSTPHHQTCCHHHVLKWHCNAMTKTQQDTNTIDADAMANIWFIGFIL